MRQINTINTHPYIHTFSHTHAHTYARTHTHMHTHNTHIYTHGHLHTHIHTRAHTYTQTCTKTHTYIHMHMYIHVHMHTHACTHTYTHKRTHTHIHTHAHIHTHTNTHIYTHTRTHTRTHTHPHTQAVPVRVHSTSTKSDFTHSLRFWMIPGPDFSGFSALYLNTLGAQSKSFQKVETQNSIETAPHEAQHVAHHLNVLTEIHSIRISRAHSMSVVQWSGRGKLVSAIEQ